MHTNWVWLLTVNNHRAKAYEFTVIIVGLSFVTIDENRNYPTSFETAIDYFTVSGTTDKVLLLISAGIGNVTSDKLSELQANTQTDLNSGNFQFLIYTANRKSDIFSWLPRPFLPMCHAPLPFVS